MGARGWILNEAGVSMFELFWLPNKAKISKYHLEMIVISDERQKTMNLNRG